MAVQELKRRLAERFGAGIEAILFGSVARGAASAESDIDILVLTPFPVNNSLEEEVFSIAYDVELLYGVVFGVIVYERAVWRSARLRVTPLFQNIAREGVSV